MEVFSRFTSPPPAGALLDGVGQVDELQVHGRAFGQVGETLSFCDLVVHLLQVGQHGRVLRLRLAPPVAHDGLLHGETNRVELQGLIVHPRSQSAGERGKERGVPSVNVRLRTNNRSQPRFITS